MGKTVLRRDPGFGVESREHSTAGGLGQPVQTDPLSATSKFSAAWRSNALRRRACWRSCPMTLLWAARKSQADGLVGRPVTGHDSSAASIAD